MRSWGKSLRINAEVDNDYHIRSYSRRETLIPLGLGGILQKFLREPPALALLHSKPPVVRSDVRSPLLVIFSLSTTYLYLLVSSSSLT